MVTRFDLILDARLEYLTLAVGNAKSHPVAVGGRHEDAISFLTELEEELDVAQVQLELYHTLSPRINEGGEVGEKIRFLTTRLFNITEVNLRLFPFPFVFLFIVDWVTRVLTQGPFFISAAALPRVGRAFRFGHDETPYLSRLGTPG